MDIQEFAEQLQTFFLIFDGYFLQDPEAYRLLIQTKESLEGKINCNEARLPVILALGGDYDSAIDRAKVKEVEAMLQLLKARKELQIATEKNRKDRNCNAAILSMFGI